MEITQWQKDELGRQLPKILKQWKQIAGPHRLPKSLEYFSREETGRILDFLANGAIPKPKQRFRQQSPKMNC
jgi:hypothetical protein